MPLWFFPALLGLLVLVSLVSFFWLLLHLPDVARVFRGDREGEIVPGPTKRRASRSTVWLMILLFNAGWIGCLIVWSSVISGGANEAVISDNR